MVKIFASVFPAEAAAACECSCSAGPPLSRTAYLAAIATGVIKLGAGLLLTALLVSTPRSGEILYESKTEYLPMSPGGGCT